MFKITLPMVKPAILSTILLVFGSSMGSYPVPHYLGLTTLATKYVSLNSKYTGEASILAIIMMIFGVAIMFQDVFGLMIYMFKLWPSAILPPLMCGLLWGKISPYAGAPAVIAGGLSFFLWSDKVLGEPFGIPANFIGIGMNCLGLFGVHQRMKGHKPEGPFLPDLN